MPPLLLYMEDDNNNRMLIHRVLQVENFDVISADNAQDGILMALKFLPDIILMDISMPTMDGYTATYALRQFPELDGIPIVAVTANVLAGDREMALKSGCDGYIPKPIDVDTFPDEIRTYLTDKLGYAYRQDLGDNLNHALGTDTENWYNTKPEDIFPLLGTHNKSTWTDYLRNQLAYGSQAIQGRAVVTLANWHTSDKEAPHQTTAGQRYFWEQVSESLTETTRRKTEIHWSHIARVALALTESNLEDSHKELELCMRSNDDLCREWALRILRVEKADNRLKLARIAMSDTDAHVRRVGVHILADGADREDLISLERALYDRDRQVRELAATGLANLPDYAGQASLIHALRTGQDNTAEVIPPALQQLNTTEAIDELVASLSYRRDVAVLRHIITALGHIDDKRCYQALRDLPEQDNPQLRTLITRLLNNHPARHE